MKCCKNEFHSRQKLLHWTYFHLCWIKFLGSNFLSYVSITLSQFRCQHLKLKERVESRAYQMKQICVIFQMNANQDSDKKIGLELEEVEVIESHVLEARTGICIEKLILSRPEICFKSSPPYCLKYLVSVCIPCYHHFLTIDIHFYFLYSC